MSERPWPTWKKVLAYVALSALSLAAVYVVDVKVHRSAVMPPASRPVADRPAG